MNGLSVALTILLLLVEFVPIIIKGIRLTFQNCKDKVSVQINKYRASQNAKKFLQTKTRQKVYEEQVIKDKIEQIVKAREALEPEPVPEISYEERKRNLRDARKKKRMAKAAKRRWQLAVEQSLDNIDECDAKEYVTPINRENSEIPFINIDQFVKNDEEDPQ